MKLKLSLTKMESSFWRLAPRAARTFRYRIYLKKKLFETLVVEYIRITEEIRNENNRQMEQNNKREFCNCTLI